MSSHIIIKGIGSVSPLGAEPGEVAQAYRLGQPAFQLRPHQGTMLPVGALPEKANEKLSSLAAEKKAYQHLDRSVLMAIYAARQAVQAAGWQQQTGIGVNIGSSRGATGLYEQYLEDYLAAGTVSSQASPVTTLGNVSSWVANDLQVQGPLISHSVTCSTALQALANGFAWLRAGLVSRFLAGGAEAPLTGFTLAQMKAIGIYSPDPQQPFPCRPHNQEGQNTFVLGEGAALFALEACTPEALAAEKTPQIELEAVGFGFETIGSKTGISREGSHFQQAIREALGRCAGQQPIDLAILHAPGTVAGDSAERRALTQVFGEAQVPVITSNKFLVGHTLGASAALSVEYACHILQTQQYLSLPYANLLADQPAPKPINRILITAAGFGGNAASVILKRV
ncbi:MAG: beta-ketoacyl synthase N-terminal-like domain-containing protein [Adhaeribacter sp.]